MFYLSKRIGEAIKGNFFEEYTVYNLYYKGIRHLDMLDVLHVSRISYRTYLVPNILIL